MTRNKLSYNELKKRTEAPQRIPFKASRLPAKNICIGEYTWEYPGVTSYTDIRFAHPSRIRPYWSLWTKTYCPMAEEFIHSVAPAQLLMHLPHDANDSPDIITHYFMIDFLNNQDTECNGFEIVRPPLGLVALETPVDLANILRIRGGFQYFRFLKTQQMLFG